VADRLRLRLRRSLASHQRPAELHFKLGVVRQRLVEELARLVALRIIRPRIRSAAGQYHGPRGHDGRHSPATLHPARLILESLTRRRRATVTGSYSHASARHRSPLTICRALVSDSPRAAYAFSRWSRSWSSGHR